jgi:solute:Na+ symporter, SSS family
MTILVFAFIILLSLAVAVLSRFGHNVVDIEQYLVAGRSFGGILLFFLAVGEIYSIGTMIGFPGGIYAKGASYGIWFLGYILLAYPVGYFLAPLMWRAAKKYGAMTLPDLFGRHFSSRGLEALTAIAAIVFLIPWGQLQFTGLEVAISALGLNISTNVAIVASGAMAFIYIALSGVRAPAFVSIVKDICMVAGIVIVGTAAVASSQGIHHLFQAAAAHHVSATMSGAALTFAVTTIIFQALGFYLFPFTAQFVFTARSEATVKRTQTFMPLYMLMYPFLVFASYYALSAVPHLANPNTAFIAASRKLLPPWLLGLVAGGAALSAILVLTAISLGVGAMVSRNLLPHLPGEAQRRWTQIVVAVYLLLSIGLTLFTPTLMLTLINTAYFGITQSLPGVLAILFARRVQPWAVALGIVVGDVLAVALYLAQVNWSGINLGLVALAVNFIVSYGVSYLWPLKRPLVPVATEEAVPVAMARPGSS